LTASPSSIAEKPSLPPRENWTVAVLFFITALLFIPSLVWVFGRAFASGQLQHAFLVMVFAAAFLLSDRRERLSPEFRFSQGCWTRLCLSFLLLVPGLWLRGPWLVFPAMCCALSAWTIYLFGSRAQRLSDTFFGAFGIYLAFLLFFPSLDWPLRVLAGRGAAVILQALGWKAELFLQVVPGRELLILAVDQRPFEVAPECNGFGLMSSAGLLAVIFFTMAPVSWAWKAAAFPMGIALGLVFNMLRIVVICLLAPAVGASYLLMHEIVGVGMFWGCLLLVRWISVKLEERLIPAGSG
jgi:exosortase/archaeosortase family protein